MADERRKLPWHLWKWGDGLTEAEQEERGWERFKLAPLDTDTTVKTTRDMLTGGTPSGLPCACGEMTMWVQSVSALKILEEGGITVPNPAQRETLLHTEVAILICPKCEAVTQAVPAIVKAARAKYLLKEAR